MPGNLTEVVTALTSTTVAAGGTFSFSARTSNISNASTGGGSTSRIFLSADAVIDPFDTVLQIRSVPMLAAFSESAQNYVVTLPANLTPGTYFIGGLADFHNQVGETNEGDNNYNRLTITVTPPPRPNLTEVVTVAYYTTVVAAGGEFGFETRTVNNGSAATSAGSTARIYLSTDPVITANDTLLYSHTTGPLSSGQTNMHDPAVTLPANLAPGTYYIGGIADYFGQIGETNEADNNNNVITITVTDRPNLRAYVEPLGPTTVAAGTDLRLETGTINDGPLATTGGSTARIYLSADPIITAQDLLLTSQVSGRIAAGARAGIDQTITLPANLAPGTYYLGAIADVFNQVAEWNETDNGEEPIAITVTAAAVPNLRAVVTALTSRTVAAGGMFSFAVNSVNEGGAATAAGSTTRVFLSSDPIITAQDTVLAIQTVGPLNAGAGAAQNYVVNLPGNLAPGTYYIGALADFHNQIGESNEGNNNGNLLTMTVLPSLMQSEAASADVATCWSGSQLTHAIASSFAESAGSLTGSELAGPAMGEGPTLILTEPTKHL